MLNDVIILLLGYAVASFVLTALFVRLGKQTGLAVKIRQRFYWFPFIPPVLFVQGFLQIVAWASRRLMSLLRFALNRSRVKKPIGDTELTAIITIRRCHTVRNWD